MQLDNAQKNQVQLDNSFNLNTNLYEYCLCCGSEYKFDHHLDVQLIHGHKVVILK